MPMERRTLLLLTTLAAGLLHASASTTAAAQTKQPDGFRLPDDRPPLDPAALEAAGLRIFQSRRLLLVTDAPPADVSGLPELADSLFEALKKKLPPLKPAADGSEFQVTGFLMEAPERFLQAGLLPDENFVIRHGRHLGYRFWMRNQPSAYYRRHLLLHEFVHCWMMCEAGMRDIPPLWFTEGLAEFLATHSTADGTSPAFGVLPEARTGFEGWGRITQIREQACGRSGYPAEELPPADAGLMLRDVLFPAENTFLSELKYAQAWALVWLLNSHPDLRSRFASVNRARSGQDFDAAFAKIDKPTLERLAVVWLLMLDCLEEDFDQQRSFPELNPRWTTWQPNASETTLEVKADRSWQASGIHSESTTRLVISATGRCVLHNQPRPWISEPHGITIDYAHSRPIGELTAIAVPRNANQPPQRIPIGRQSTIELPPDSELWLQINDHENSREGNSAGYKVMIRSE
ncbi:MAG: hypothetical protein RLZZ436_4545 [Planctomycetota bacterium]|jgi:hypothetical protein